MTPAAAEVSRAQLVDMLDDTSLKDPASIAFARLADKEAILGGNPIKLLRLPA